MERIEALQVVRSLRALTGEDIDGRGAAILIAYITRERREAVERPGGIYIDDETMCPTDGTICLEFGCGHPLPRHSDDGCALCPCHHG